MNLNLKVGKKFRFLYESTARYKILYGGRGGGKTWHIADRLVLKIINETAPDAVYLCLRETQEQLMDSTKSTIWKSIKKLELEYLFYTSRTSSEILCLTNGCKFIFRGCRNLTEVDKLCSIENACTAWLEEAHNLKAEVWERFTPSVRHPLSTDSEIIVSFNPMRKTDFVYNHFVDEGDPLAEVVNVNYYDNPFFEENKTLVAEMGAKKSQPYAFRRIWLGEPGFIENQLIKPEWWSYFDSLVEAMKVCTGMYITADTAYKTGTLNDYSVIQCWGYNSGHQLYLIDQVRGKWEFPTLVSKVKEFTRTCHTFSKIVKPSRLLIEDKASGISLVQTLAREGLNVIPWKPKDYQFPDDKIGRANEAALIISSGCVYIPKPTIAKWVNDFVTECSEFTDDKNLAGHDDQVDALTMAISVWRKMGGGIMPQIMRGTA